MLTRWTGVLLVSAACFTTGCSGLPDHGTDDSRPDTKPPTDERPVAVWIDEFQPGMPGEVELLVSGDQWRASLRKARELPDLDRDVPTMYGRPAPEFGPDIFAIGVLCPDGCFPTWGPGPSDEPNFPMCRCRIDPEDLDLFPPQIKPCHLVINPMVFDPRAGAVLNRPIFECVSTACAGQCSLVFTRNDDGRIEIGCDCR